MFKHHIGYLFGSVHNCHNLTMYLQYRYGYDSQTSSEFEHNCKIDQLIYTSNLMKCKVRGRLLTEPDSPGSTFIVFTKLLEHANFYHCSIPVLLNAPNDLDSHHFFPFLIPTLQHLAKGTWCIPETHSVMTITRRSYDSMVSEHAAIQTDLRPFSH